jgi:hypothetical protein
MTKESRTKFEWESGSGEASVNLSTFPGDCTIIHDSFTNYGERKHVCQNMPVEIAREMAQWILDSTEPPEPTLQEQFAALEVGDKFVLEGSVYVREKIGDDLYLNLALSTTSSLIGAPEKHLTKV